jgi:DNA (cytosine-5)-methyltransferase 1
MYDGFSRELDKNSIEAYGNAIVPEIDIKDLNAIEYYGKIDIVSGGFPCQDISSNGNGKGIKGERSGLWKEYARIVWECRPKFIIFENSPLLVRAGFEYILSDLARMGYDVEWRSFYASQFGFPHYRERIYGIAYSPKIRWDGYMQKGGILHQIIPERVYKTPCPDLPLERMDTNPNPETIRMYDGFSRELDKNSIEAYGNAIVPEIAYRIFKQIELYFDTSN